MECESPPAESSAAFVPSASFPKAERLLKRADFLRVQAGRKFTTPRLAVLCDVSPTGQTRFGVTVSKKVGSAPIRARVKRLLREAYRLNKVQWPTGLDFVAIARADAATADLRTLEHDLLRWAQGLKRHASKSQG